MGVRLTRKRQRTSESDERFSCLTWRFEGPGIPTAPAPRSSLGELSPVARGDRAHTVPAGSPPSSPPVGAVRRHVSQNGDRAARAGVLLAVTLSPPFRDRRRPRHRRRQHRLAPRASPSPPPPPALDLATASFWGSAGGLPASPPPPLSSSATASARSVSRRPPRALTATVGRSSPPPRRRCLIWAGSGAGNGNRQPRARSAKRGACD